ncbi:unnamed protein product [Owenia fusiformis]|uniref:RUN and FYVE domain-containing protein 4 n=1 Tax=Owenia fusiformis TaxID=6347 RepID=A0A8J1USH4_OWEFU|nr:unnamed protein product [Owenia fusiformis]
MAEPVMENPLLAGGQPQFTKMVSDLQGCIQEMKREFVESQVPINDDNQMLHRFTAKLEYLLQAGQKVRTGLLGGKKDYWDYIVECLSATKGQREGIKFVKSNGELKTSLGRGRGLIRFALVHQRLADTLQQCIMNGRVTSEWFHPKSVWLNHAVSSSIINALYDLNDIQFDLSSQGYDLDAAWPTFARKTFGSPTPNWPVSRSRTSSISSLQSVDQSPMKAESIAETELQRLRRELTQSEALINEMKLKVSEAEKDNEMSGRLMSQTEQQLNTTRQKCNEYEVMCDKLNNELKLKEESWKEREDNMSTKLSEKSQQIENIKAQLDETNTLLKEQTEALQNKESETKTKIEHTERLNSELLLKMKSYSQKMEHQVTLSDKKGEVINSLEQKLVTLEKKNSELMGKIEIMVKEKGSEASNHLDSANRAHELLQKLTETEQLNIDLRGQNEDHIRKLNVSNEKYDKLSKSSNEKITTLETAQHKLEASVSDLEDVNKDNLRHIGELTNTITNYESMKVTMEQKIEVLHSEKAEFESVSAKLSNDLADLQQEYSQMHEVKDTVTNELHESEQINQEIKQKIEQLTHELNEREKSVERDKGEYSDQISTMEAKLSSLDETIAKRTKENEILISEKDKLMGEHQESVLANQESLHKICTLEESLASKEVTIGMLEQQLSGLKGTLESMESGADDIDSGELNGVETNGNMGDRLKHIVADRKLLRGQLTAMETQNSTLSLQIQQLEKKITSMVDESNEMLKEYTKLKGVVETMQSSESKLNVKLTEMESLIESKDESLVQCESQKVQYQNELEQYRTQLEESKKTIDSLGDSKKRLIEENELTQTMLSEATTSNQDLQGKMAATIEEHNTTVKQIQKQHQEVLAEKQCKFEELEKKNNTENEILKTSIQTLEKQVSDKVKMISGLEIELNEKSEAFTELQKEIGNLSNESGNINEMCNKLKLETESLNETIKKQNEENTELSSKYTDVSQQLQETCAKANLIESERQKSESHNQTTINELQKESEAMKSKLSGMETIKTELENKIINLQDNVDTMGETKNTMQSRILEIENENKELISNREALDQDIEDLRNANSELENNVTNLNTLIKDSNDENDKLKSDLNDKCGEISELNEELLTAKDNCNKLKLEISEMNATQQNCSIELSEKEISFEKQQNDLQNEIKQLSEKITESEMGLEEKSKLIVSLEGEKCSLLESVKTLEQKILDQQTEMSSQANDLQNVREELKSAKNLTEQEIKGLKFQLSSEKMQYETALKGYLEQNVDISSMNEKMTDQEQIIETLEMELEEIRTERSLEQDRQWRELEDLRSLVSSRDEECRMLNEELRRINTILDEERNLVLKYKNELTSAMKENEAEKTTMRSDMVEMQKKLVKLLREKDNLWQKTDKLEYMQKVKASDKWMDDKEVPSCMNCNSDFSLMLRRHHCRMCGRIFCYNCSNNWTLTPQSSKKIRVCNDCFMSHSELREEKAPKDGEEGEEAEGEFEQSIQLPHKRSPSWKAPDGQSDHSSSLTAESTTSTEELEASVGEDASIIDTETPAPENSVNIPINEGGGSSHDDTFECITEEEISRSLSESEFIRSSDSTYNPSHLQLSHSDLERRNNTERNSDVPPGDSFTVSVEIKAGMALSWHFTTEPKSVSFSVTFEDCKEGASLSTLIPACKVNSHKEPVQGELTARQTGTYSLVFSNTSRTTNKRDGDYLYQDMDHIGDLELADNSKDMIGPYILDTEWTIDIGL